MEERGKDVSTFSDHSKNILISTFFLTIIGLLLIYSSSSIQAFHKLSDPYHYFKKQFVVVLFGFFLIYLISKFSIQFLKKITLPLLIGSLILVVLTHIPSIQFKANGAARWIRILGINFQPAELAKVAILLFLSKSLSLHNQKVTSFFKDILPNLAIITLFAIPLMMQPDFGSTVLIFSVSFLLLFVAGMPIRFVVSGSILALCAIALAVYVSPYRLMRLLSFMDPWSDAKNSGFQIIQSYVGFQNGGFFGLGFGESKQKLFFLPEAHTDFILSIIGEELGVLGVLFIITNFATIAFCGYKIAIKQSDDYAKFLAFGITALITLQAIINMGVTMGMLPTKGISLPFVSNGSSSILIFLIIIGILIRLDKKKQTNDSSKASNYIQT